MALRITILLLLLLGSLNCVGCSTIRLYPIAQQDIVIMKKGISYIPDRDGYFLSQLYMDEVVQAKVDRIKLK